MTFKEILENHKDFIIEVLNQEPSTKVSRLAQMIIKEFELEIESDRYDSFRRAVSTFTKELRKDDSAVDEEKLKQKVADAVKSEEPPMTIKRADIFESDINEEFTNVGDDDMIVFDNDEIDETSLAEHEFSHKYHYDKAGDEYLFFNMRSKTLKFTGTLIRSMKEAYSNDGQKGMTINEVSREFQLPRWVFAHIKTSLAWSHDSEPFTDEEFAEADSSNKINDMVEAVIAKRKFEYFQKLSRAEAKLVLTAANKWWAFKGLELNPFLEKYNPESRPVERLETLTDSKDKYGLVISPFDLHYGKYGWSNEVGVEYNRDIARDLLIKKTKAMIPDLRKYNIEKIIIPVGSDFFHIDTMRGTTTKGTPQDCDGTYTQIMVEGNKLMLDFVDMMRQVADVEIILTAGNHDFKLSHSLLELMAAHYRNNDDVVVKRAHHFRQYTSYGTTLIGCTHGDSTKLSELPMCMSREAKEEWAKAKHYAYFHGHLHHEVVRDINGVKLYQMPSLSGSDRWHHNHNYEGSVRGLAGYLIHKTKGVRVTIMENV